MPTEATILDFENHWQKKSFPHAVAVELPSGRTIRASLRLICWPRSSRRSSPGAKGPCSGPGLTRTIRCRVRLVAEGAPWRRRARYGRPGIDLDPGADGSDPDADLIAYSADSAVRPLRPRGPRRPFRLTLHPHPTGGDAVELGDLRDGRAARAAAGELQPHPDRGRFGELGGERPR
jgi:hypothetical protein